MVKTLVSMISVGIILLSASIFEGVFVSKKFNDFSLEVKELYFKINDENATTSDVLAVQKSWVQKKKYLHIFIPHNEIKELDLWLSETIILVRDEKWSDALSKVEVLGELTEQIPKTFLIKIENIL